MNILSRSLRVPIGSRSRRTPGKPQIDARQRAAELSDAELVQGADSYFARLTPESVQFKKPFSDPHQAVQLTQHVSLLFECAHLFRGAKVLDFGCSTGWLSLAMAQMGCDVDGVDISTSAIRLAERLKNTRHARSDGALEFRTYDGTRLPFADGTFDRIVCCDALHHVRDQAFVIKEFARILKDGGRAAFVEPGPNHSKTKLSQAEMRRHRVLENDVCMSDIAAHARAAGLNTPSMLLQFQRPVELSYEEFADWSENGIPVARAHGVLRKLQREMTDAQFFSISKGMPRPDSRSLDALGAELQLIEAHNDGSGFCSFRVTARNTGSGTWLTEKGRPGQVRLGWHLLDSDGKLVNLDYARFDVEGESVPPAQQIEVSGRVKLPDMERYSFRVDLVSEHVSWFEQSGSSVPVDVSSEEL
jgi:2-polyprenyl-3-methyl-5-hydroxy-6-metoxy-1,4-benzoquinol methylase